MKKTEFVKEVAQRAGVSVSEATKVVDSAIAVITESVKNGEAVGITGFGTFDRSYRSEHKGRNPQTGEEITIEGKFLPVFKAGAPFKDAVK